MKSTQTERSSFTTFKTLQVQVALSHKNAGNMSKDFADDEKEVEKNRKAICREAGFNPQKMVLMKPQHTGKAVHVEESDIYNGPSADALFTKNPDLVLAFTPGDCFPVVIVNEERDFLALIHASVKTLPAEIMSKTFELIDEEINFLNSGPFPEKISKDKLKVGIGPGVRSCCHDIEALKEAGGLTSEQKSRLKNKREELDLGKGSSVFDILKGELKRQNISPSNISEISHCTCCYPKGKEKIYFSHRRVDDKRERGILDEEEGRGLVLASL